MDMAMPTTNGSSSSPGLGLKPPPPPPGYVVQKKAAAADSYNGHRGAPPATRASARHNEYDHHQARALYGVVLLLLRAAAAAMAFVAVALVASCRHGDWMEFARYPEYTYLLGTSVLACLYSAAQALRSFRRMRYGGTAPSAGLADFAGDQLVAYLLITAASAALPITLRMRSAVINLFTVAITAAVSLGFVAFAALALSAMLSGLCTLSSRSAQPYYY